jgi:hypothetical protein
MFHPSPSLLPGASVPSYYLILTREAGCMHSAYSALLQLDLRYRDRYLPGWIVRYQRRMTSPMLKGMFDKKAVKETHI